MATFDYCTPDQVKQYLTASGGSGDDLLLARLCTAVSRAIDTYTSQIWYEQLYAPLQVEAIIDRDGALICWPGVPKVTSLTAASYRIGRGPSWQSVSVAEADIDLVERQSGAQLTLLGVDLSRWRDQRVALRLSMTAGYASLDELPADLAWYASLAAAAEYKKREAAGGDATAMPGIGPMNVPRDWPPHVVRGLSPFCAELPI